MTIPTEHATGLAETSAEEKFATTRVHSTLGWLDGARYSGIIIRIIMVYPAIGIYRDMQGDIGIYTYTCLKNDI